MITAEKTANGGGLLHIRSISPDADKRTLFQMVQNTGNWKDRTELAVLDSEQDAKRLAEAISFYQGGVEFEHAGKTWMVYGKGYYAYMGC